MDRCARIDAILHSVLEPVILDGVGAAAITIFLAKDKAIQRSPVMIAIDDVMLDRPSNGGVEENDRVNAVGANLKIRILDGGIVSRDLDAPTTLTRKVVAV